MSNLAVAQPLRRLRAVSWVAGVAPFIGWVHRIAAELDGQAQVVCGCNVSSPRRPPTKALRLVSRSAPLTSYEAMASSEAAPTRTASHFAIIATPAIDLHLPPVARAFPFGRLHVICAKPLALTGRRRGRTGSLVEAARPVCAHPQITPAIRPWRQAPRNGAWRASWAEHSGKVMVEYTPATGWMEPWRGVAQAGPLETDTGIGAGLSGCVGDNRYLHAQNLLEFVDRTVRSRPVCGPELL